MEILILNQTEIRSCVRVDADALDAAELGFTKLANG